MKATVKSLVIMFVKEPQLGFVKTRLAKSCGDEFVLALYEAFVKDLIEILYKSEFDFKLCVYPNLELINRKFGEFNNFLQVEGDLGVKMQSAFEQQFAHGYDKIVLIGSDTPHISPDMIKESFDALAFKDMVFGPSLDGGYYLIAFNKNSFNNEVFKDISWSSELVLEQTLQKLHKNQVYFLHELNDIDVLDDLKAFYKNYKNSDFKDSNTIEFLKESQLWKSLM